MKYSVIFYLFPLFLTGCDGNKSSDDAVESEYNRKTVVTLTHGVRGHLERESIFQATTVYRDRSVITTPVSGFITEVFVTAGTRVRNGQLLYRIESKERHAVGGSDNDGVIAIKASHEGIVLNTALQVGDYAMEGTALCAIADSRSMVFEINVPFEQHQEVYKGSKCTMVLPDGSRYSATIQHPLVSMDTASQSEQVIAVADCPFLPEGLRVKALFTALYSTNADNLILPKSAVQSDETLTSHWVMKLTSDSTAVKVPVEVAGCEGDEIEVSSADLSIHDNIILTGGYGLEPDMKVTVVKRHI